MASQPKVAGQSPHLLAESQGFTCCCDFKRGTLHPPITTPLLLTLILSSLQISSPVSYRPENLAELLVGLQNIFISFPRWRPDSKHKAC